jgi:hypothetical protein
MAADTILFNEVIGRMKPQLEMLRKGFSETRLLKYLQNHPYLIDAAFPRETFFMFPPAAIITRISCNEGCPLFDDLKRFINEDLEGMVTLKQSLFLSAQKLRFL